LQDEAKAMTNNVVVLEKLLVEMRKSIHAKMTVLHEDKDATLLELQATRAFIRKFESVVEEQNENISSLQEANDELQNTLCSMIEESERAKVKRLDEVKTTQKEKDIVVTRLKQSESYIKNLENEVALIKEISVQLENNSKLDKHLEEATLKVSKLHEKLEKSQAEMASHIDGMNLKTKELEDKIDALSSQKTKVEEDLKILVEACSGNMSKMKEFEDTVKQRTTNDVTRFRPIHQSLKEVLSRYQKLQCAYDELSARTSRFEVLEQNQMEQVDKIHQLKEEKLNTFMENTKLHKHVQGLEIQLQHVKLKLMENKWKEDRFAATLETSQAEIQNLEQLVSLLEETLQEIKEHAESGVFSMVEQLDKLESSFSQGFPRFVYRSSASNEELKVLRNKLHGHLDEQKELLKKKDGLAIRLRNKEKVLSEMVRNDADERILEKKLVEKESGEERTNNTSKRWPILRRRKWRRNSYSC
jgi:chromosome segregation ATPase